LLSDRRGLTVEACCSGQPPSSRCGSYRAARRPCPSSVKPTPMAGPTGNGGATSRQMPAAAAHPERRVRAASLCYRRRRRSRFNAKASDGCSSPDLFGDTCFVNSTADSKSRPHWPGRIWDEGDGNPSALEAEDTAFDSRVPDAWVARVPRTVGVVVISPRSQRGEGRFDPGTVYASCGWGVHGDMPLFHSGGVRLPSAVLVPG
jgi:hypothetical protein